MDVLRGVAVLGILAMNIMSFSGPMAGYMNPTVWPGEYAGGNRAAWWLTYLLFDMKMMSLFGILFGAGVVAFSAKARSREETASIRWLWLRRMGWLLTIGMAHAWLLWEGDILVAYALCGLIVVWWLRRLPIPWLLVVAAAMFVVHIALALTQAFSIWLAFGEHSSPPFGIPAEQFAELRTGMKEFMAPTPEMIERQIAERRGSWSENFFVRAEMNVYVQLQGIPFFVFWRSSALMLLGVALARTGVLTGARSVRFYAWMAAAGYGVGLPMVLAGLLDSEAHGFDLMRRSLVDSPLNLVGSVLVALGHAGVVLLMVRLGAAGAARRALGAVGRMAMTNYLAQTLICTTLFYGYGLGLYGSLERPALLAIVAAIWAAQLAWSPLWISRFRFGPAEWAWRSLTYWRAQPIRRPRPGREPAGQG